MTMKPTGKSRAKILLYAVLIAYAPSSFAQSADTATPPALAAARAQYKDTVADDTRMYLAKLAQLKAYASRTGDAALAAAVRREIASVVASQATVAIPRSPKLETAAKKNPTPVDVEASLVNSTWVWYRWETFKLLPHGKAQESAIPAPTMTWQVASNTPPVITGTTPTGTKYTMTLDSDLQSGTIKEGDGPGRITARVPTKQGG